MSVWRLVTRLNLYIRNLCAQTLFRAGLGNLEDFYKIIGLSDSQVMAIWTALEYIYRFYGATGFGDGTMADYWYQWWHYGLL